MNCQGLMTPSGKCPCRTAFRAVKPNSQIKKSNGKKKKTVLTGSLSTKSPYKVEKLLRIKSIPPIWKSPKNPLSIARVEVLIENGVERIINPQIQCFAIAK